MYGRPAQIRSAMVPGVPVYEAFGSKYSIVLCYGYPDARPLATLVDPS